MSADWLDETAFVLRDEGHCGGARAALAVADAILGGSTQ